MCVIASRISSILTLRYRELTLFFPAGGELATEEVLESSDASCRIIEFESAEGNSNR